MEYEAYKHHGRIVAVQKELKGKHRGYCLCHKCAKFKPKNRDDNCPIARAVFANCVEFGITTPVWECPNFKPKDSSPILYGEYYWVEE